MRHYFIVFCISGTNIGNTGSCSALELKLPMWFAEKNCHWTNFIFSDFCAIPDKGTFHVANMVQVRIQMAFIPGFHPIQDIVVQLMFVRFLSTTLFVTVWISMKNVFWFQHKRIFKVDCCCVHVRTNNWPTQISCCTSQQLPGKKNAIRIPYQIWQAGTLTGWNCLEDQIQPREFEWYVFSEDSAFARMRWHGVILNDSVGWTGPFLVLEAKIGVAWVGAVSKGYKVLSCALPFTDKFRKAEKPKVADTCFEWHLQ